MVLNFILKSILNSARITKTEMLNFILKSILILASCSNAGFSAANSLIVQKWHCPLFCMPLTASPIPPFHSSKQRHIHRLHSLCIFSQHYLRKVLKPFLHPELQELLECLLVQLVQQLQLIQTLLEICTDKAICAGNSGRLKVGNKYLGYLSLQTLIQCRACQ